MSNHYFKDNLDKLTELFDRVQINTTQTKVEEVVKPATLDALSENDIAAIHLQPSILPMIKHPYIEFVCEVAGRRQMSVADMFQKIPLNKQDPNTVQYYSGVVLHDFFDLIGVTNRKPILEKLKRVNQAVYQAKKREDRNDAFNDQDIEALNDFEAMIRKQQVVNLEVMLQFLRDPIRSTWYHYDTICKVHKNKSLAVILPQYYHKVFWVVLVGAVAAHLTHLESLSIRAASIPVQARTAYKIDTANCDKELLIQLKE